MSSETYNINFAYKRFNLISIQSLFNMLENIDGLEISINIVRKVKIHDSTKEERKNNLKVSEFIKYLTNDSNGVKNLNELEINLNIINEQVVTIKYIDFLGIKYWRVIYDRQSKTVDAVIYNLKKIYKNSLFNLYHTFSNLIFFILCIAGTTSDSNIKLIFSTLLIVLLFDKVLYKELPYKNSKFLLKNKDSIVLSIIFYVLGVITPYLVEILLKLIK